MSCDGRAADLLPCCPSEENRCVRAQDESRPEQREERFWWKLALQLAITPQQVMPHQSICLCTRDSDRCDVREETLHVSSSLA